MVELLYGLRPEISVSEWFGLVCFLAFDNECHRCKNFLHLHNTAVEPSGD